MAGTGFPTKAVDCSFTVCSQTATIKAISNIEATISIPECGTIGADTVAITYNSLSASDVFTFSAATTALEITSITPVSSSPVLKARMNITGSGFGTDANLITVFLTNSTGNIYQLRVLEVTDILIKVGLSGGLPGNFDVNVIKQGEGNAVANPATANDFAYEVIIDSISPTTGSVFGGTLLTITGRNFIPTDAAESMVTIGDELNQLCTIESITETEIKCRTPAKHADEATETDLKVLVNNKLIIDSTCSGTCMFQYVNDTIGPALSSTGALNLQSTVNSTLQLSGIRFSVGSTCKAVLYNKLTKKTTEVTPTTCTDTFISFDPPVVESGFYSVKARADDIGESNGTSIVMNVHITQANPTSVSINGGQVTI